MTIPLSAPWRLVRMLLLALLIVQGLHVGLRLAQSWDVAELSVLVLQATGAVVLTGPRTFELAQALGCDVEPLMARAATPSRARRTA